MSDETNATGERRRRWRLRSVRGALPLAVPERHPKAATGHPERADRRRWLSWYSNRRLIRSVLLVQPGAEGAGKSLGQT
jgi:hypothetical protein